MRYFPYTDFILESCEKLDQRGEYPSDKYIWHIVQLQRLLERAEDTVRYAKSSSDDMDDINANISSIRDQMDSFKSNLSFSLSDCRMSPTFQALNIFPILMR